MLKEFIIPEKAHKEAADQSNLSFAFSRGTIKVVDIPEKVIEIDIPETDEPLYYISIFRTSHIYPEPMVEQTNMIPLSALGYLIKKIYTLDEFQCSSEIIIDMSADDGIRLEIYDDCRE